MIGGHLSLPLHILFSPNASDQNFEIASLFELVQRSDDKNFRVHIPPSQSPGEGLKFMPKGHIKFYGRGGRINFGGDSNDKKLKVSISFLRVKKDPIDKNSSPSPLFPQFIRLNFYMVILFKIKQRTYDKNSRDNNAFQNPGASVVNYAPGA